MRKNAEQRHEELLALLAEFPDLTNSDYSSVNIISYIGDFSTHDLQETGTVTSLGARSVDLFV
jgi:hypothetical protein